MTVQQWSKLSTQGRIEWLTQYQVVNSFPANRPEIVSVAIPVTNTNDIVVSDLLVGYQVFSIVGFSAAPARFIKTDLSAKIASYAGVTLDELNYLQDAVLQTNGFTISNLQYSIITSDAITITLNGGHGLTSMNFYCLPASYNVSQPNPQDSNLFS